ncbi:uncharacterized protein A1O9_12102 [Exophiala aquamarina CBS 119918]|uniref:Transcription factor domain-containing protein n=1 Tax=Exophiala aquamarina CBS 119918 TaxID=1182545 RepID=A0A072P892_9EURO|nr:uncharacterized protein A1O9_12102 [Exophiala aquamarina CBS 119918]KEF51765.1 hypothetical protein A1O9_12102 [Exophiala aquamarina CBS 119918]
MDICDAFPSRASQKDGQYFFINKSRKSVHLSRSSLAEKAAIQSHVQTGTKRNRPAKSRLSVVVSGHFRSDKGRNFVSSNSASSAATQDSKMLSQRSPKSFALSKQEERSQKPERPLPEATKLGTAGSTIQFTQSRGPTMRLLFVDSRAKGSQRERELEDAQRKAHAAIETHRKKKMRSRQGVLQSTGNRSPDQVWIESPESTSTSSGTSGELEQPSQILRGTSPTDQMILSKIDPFGTGSIKFDKTVANLLHYYVYFYHPTIWPNEMAVLRHGCYVFEGAVNNIMSTVMEDKLVMYCLLSAAASRFQFVDRLPSAEVMGKEGYYVQNALQLLRCHVASTPLQGSEQLRRLLICIMFLTSAEAYRDEVSAAKTHLKAAVVLLKEKGGLKYMQDENLRGQLAMADLYLACIKLEPCLFDCAYDPGSASALNLEESELDQLECKVLGTSFLDRDTDLIPLELGTLIGQVCETYSIRSQLRTSSMVASRVMQATHWITTRNMAIRHRLLALKTDDSRVHALRVAIIMWTLLSMNVTGRTKTVKHMALTLRLILAEISDLDWIDSEDIGLWILLVGFACSAEGSEVSVWYAEQCYCFGSGLIPVSLDQDREDGLAMQLESFQLGYFFDLQVQRSRTRRLAQHWLQLQDVQG